MDIPLIESTGSCSISSKVNCDCTTLNSMFVSSVPDAVLFLQLKQYVDPSE